MYRNLAIDITKLQDEALPLIDEILYWLDTTAFYMCDDIVNFKVQDKLERIRMQCRTVHENLRVYKVIMKKDIESIIEIETKYKELDIDYVAPYLPTSVSNTNHSFSQYSDKTAIEINKTECFTKLANKLTPEEYEIFCKYAEGKTLSELVDENGNLKPLPEDEELKKSFYMANEGLFFITALKKFVKILSGNLIYKQTYNEIVISASNSNYNRINDIITKTSFMKLNDEIKDLVIEEIVSDESGFDCVVLKDQEGNYVISASSTNNSSVRDVNTIGYTLINSMYSENMANYLTPILLESTGKITGFNDIDKLTTAKEAYYGQLNACSDIIIKYCDVAKENGTTVELNGYSLGGGIMTAAYAYIKAGLYTDRATKNSIDNVITSVNVFNPYLLYMSLIKNKKSVIYYGFNYSWQAIAEIRDDKKLTIYANEGDIVPILNKYNMELKNRFVFIPTKEKTWGIGMENPLSLFQYIVGGFGTHGYSAMDYSNFDENGNLINEGKYLNSNEIWAKYLGIEYPGTSYNPDFQFILSATTEPLFISEIFNKLKEEYGVNIKDVVDYLINNAGNFDKEYFADTLIPVIRQLLKNDEIEYIIEKYCDDSDSPFIELLGDCLDWEEGKSLYNKVIEIVIDLLEENNNLDRVYEIIFLFLQGDKEGAIEKIIGILSEPENKEILIDEISNEGFIYNVLETFKVLYSCDAPARTLIEDMLKKPLKDKFGSVNDSMFDVEIFEFFVDMIITATTDIAPSSDSFLDDIIHYMSGKAIKFAEFNAALYGFSKEDLRKFLATILVNNMLQ